MSACGSKAESWMRECAESHMPQAMPPQATAGLLKPQPLPPHHGHNGSAALANMQHRSSRGTADSGGSLPQGNGTMTASMPLSMPNMYSSAPAARAGHQPP